MITGKKFLDEIEAFLIKWEMSSTNFGINAVGDGNFVGDLREGRMPSLRLVERVQEYIVAHELHKSKRERAKVAS
jgi:hypothetical protein